MAGRKGGEKIIVNTKFLSLDKALGSINIQGCIPGSRNCVVYIYLPKKES
jgi:ribosomal protein L3